jgi:hypothetical protein
MRAYKLYENMRSLGLYNLAEDQTTPGMGISKSDWSIFTSHHVAATFDHLLVGDPERGDVLSFIESLKGSIVEVPERKW